VLGAARGGFNFVVAPGGSKNKGVLLKGNFKTVQE
jgi:hypothetical protein